MLTKYNMKNDDYSSSNDSTSENYTNLEDMHSIFDVEPEVQKVTKWNDKLDLGSFKPAITPSKNIFAVEEKIEEKTFDDLLFDFDADEDFFGSDSMKTSEHSSIFDRNLFTDEQP